MTRPVSRCLLSLALASPLTLAAHVAHAQEGGDVMEEKDDKAQSSSDEDDGGWEGETATTESGGLNFGLRLAFGLPLGDVSGSSSSTSGSTTTSTTGGKMSDVAVGQIPIWVDLGWQATRSFMVGAYLSYGFGILGGDLKTACSDGNLRCSLGDIRTGAQVQFSFTPGHSVDPWIGAGLGYEWLHLKTKDGSSTFHGWEIPMLQGGLDFATAGKSYVGPFVALSFARYSRASASAGGNSASADISPTAMHEWLFIGVRGVMR